MSGAKLEYPVFASSVRPELKHISSVTIDSRQVVKGSLFVALSGECHDGHDFVQLAVDAGAVAVLIDQHKLPQVQKVLCGRPVGILAAENSLKALQQLASSHVARYPSIQKIGITGSCGKTTTKELIASILSVMGKTVKTPGNYNSEIGLPLSVLHLTKDTEFGVFEMGIDHKGEMDSLLSVWAPQYSVLTNIGISHLEKMGSLQAIASEKSKIFHPTHRQGFISERCGWKKWISNVRNCEPKYYGKQYLSGLEGIEDLGLDGWNIRFDGKKIHLSCIGEHSLDDAFAAISVARSFGALSQEIKEGIESMIPVKGRSRVVQGPVTIIEDCYNASMDSTSSMLDYLRTVSWRGAKKVVLGSMKELGQASARAHEYVGKKLAAVNPTSTFLFGKEMELAWKALKTSGYSKNLVFTNDFQELQQAVGQDTKQGDLVLIKGSRVMGMERLMPALTATT